MSNPDHNDKTSINLTSRTHLRPKRTKNQYLVEGFFVGGNAPRSKLIYENFIKAQNGSVSQNIVKQLQFLLDPYQIFNLKFNIENQAEKEDLTQLYREYFFKSEEQVMKSFFTIPIPSTKTDKQTLKKGDKYATTQGEVSFCTNPSGKKYCSCVIVPDLQLEENCSVDIYKDSKHGIQELLEMKSGKYAFNQGGVKQSVKIVKTRFLLFVYSRFPFFDQHRQFLQAVYTRIKVWRIKNYIKNSEHVSQPNFSKIAYENSYFMLQNVRISQKSPF